MCALYGYHITGNRRRPYAVKITTGYTIEGKQTRKIIGYFSSKKDALNCLLNIIKTEIYI